MPDEVLAFLFFLTAFSLSAFSIFVFPLAAFILYLRYRAKTEQQSISPKKWASLLNSKRLFLAVISSISLGMVLCLCVFSIPSAMGVLITFPTVSSDWGSLVGFQSNQPKLLNNTLNKNPVPNQEINTAIDANGLNKTPLLTVSLTEEKKPILSPTIVKGQTLQITAAASSTNQAIGTNTKTGEKQSPPTVSVLTPTASKTSGLEPSQNETTPESNVPEAEFEGTPPPPDELLPEPDEDWEELQ